MWRLPGPIREIAATRDGRYVAVCVNAGIINVDSKIFILDGCTGREVSELVFHRSDIAAIQFVEYTSRLVSAGYDGALASWNVDDPNCKPTLILRSRRSIRRVSTIPESNRIAMMCDDELVLVDEVLSNSRASSLGRFEDVKALDLSNDGQLVVLTTLDDVVVAVSAENGRVRGDQLIEWASVERPIFSKRGDRVAIVAWGRHGELGTRIVGFDTRPAGRLKVNEIAAGPSLLDAVWCDSDQLLVGAGEDGYIVACDSNSLAPRWSTRAHKLPSRSVAYSRERGFVYSGGDEGLIEILDVNSGKVVTTRDDDAANGEAE